MIHTLRGPVAGAIAVIGVGVGLAAMVFALADAYVWKPLPFANSDRLVSIGFDPLPSSPAEWMRVTQADLPLLASWQSRTDLFAGLAAFEDRGWMRVQVSDRVMPLRAVAVSDNLLEVLGVETRWPEFDADAVWVSHRVATTLSGGTLTPGQSAPVLPEGVLRVRSVLPPTFLLPEPDRTLPVDVLVVLPPGPVMTREGASTTIPGLVARIRPGVTTPVIEAALSATMPAGRRVSVVPLPAVMTARLRGLATGALLASSLIVLVCWANVFSIALTRGLYRGPELATRAALGATPGRILALAVREGVAVTVAGSAAALTVAWMTLSAAVVVNRPGFIGGLFPREDGADVYRNPIRPRAA